MNPNHIAPFLLPGLLAAAPLPQPAQQIRHLSTTTDALRGLEVVRGELMLPVRQPHPRLSVLPAETGLAQVFLIPPQAFLEAPWRRKEALGKQQEAVAYAKSRILEAGFGSALKRYADTHHGEGPTSLTEPAWLQAVAQGAVKGAKLPPYKAGSPEAKQVETLQKALAGFALVPKVPLSGHLAPTRQEEDKPLPLLIEIAPEVEDGRHWILDSSLEADERVPVDPALLQRHHLSLSRKRLIQIPAEPDPDTPMAWTVLALRRGNAPSAQLLLKTGEGQAQPLSWAFDRNPKTDPEGGQWLYRWAYARAMTWRQGQGSMSPLIPYWVEALPRLYGRTKDNHWPERRRFMEEEGREDTAGPSLLSLLGGRAAVDETLQTDRTPTAPESTSAATVPVKDLPGIPVASHPFNQMLAGRKVMDLPLADCVPVDRSFIYLPHPKEALEELSQGGANFLQRVSGLLREGVLDHDVIARAKEDLGLGSPLGRKLLEMGAVKEAAAFTTDLALLAGTEWTVVAELHPSLRSVGALMLGSETVKTVPTSSGQAYWALRGTRLFLSTNRTELDRALALEASRGTGSLGQSDEFRYMRLKLAPTPKTQAFVYLSDPFIRRLVGPEERILQMRQGTERKRMEELAAAVELRRLDHPGGARDHETLKRLGYLRAGFPMEGLNQGKGGEPISQTWGTLSHLRPLAKVALKTVTEEEAKTYASFQETYTSYWQRYFDPIAFRLDSGADGGRSLETFILPLLEHSIYREWREIVASEEKSSPMTLPAWTQPMVAQISLKLPPMGTRVQHRLPQSISRMEPYWADLGAQLGSTVHIAFPDAAPVTQIGGGSPVALFNTSSPLGRDRWLMLAPLLLGPLTRPMVMAVEVNDPAKARAALDALNLPTSQSPLWRDEWLRVQLSREEDGRLILSTTILGTITQRYSLRVEDRWLVIANDTTLAPRLVSGVLAQSSAQVSLGIHPAALKLGLPAAYQASVESEASRVWNAQRWLAPWLSGGATVEEAQSDCRRVFGSAPVFGPDSLGEAPGVERLHKRFGTPFRPLMPPYAPGKDFGLLEGVHDARVEMQFEDDGLRTRVYWK